MFKTPPLLIEPFNHPLVQQHRLSVFWIRTDALHPTVSGNKWFKLKRNLAQLQQLGCRRVLSFGGAYSNHLHALAYATQQLGMECVGVVRGEPVSNPSLEDVTRWGMQLHFVSREQYRQRDDAGWQQALMQQWDADALIPEGGSNALAVAGVVELMDDIMQRLPHLEYLLTPCGTGGTLAGLLAGAPDTVCIEGYPVLKQGAFLYPSIQSLVEEAGEVIRCAWHLDLDAHYGGYGKVNAEHRTQWQALEAETGVLLDPIYTAKMVRRFLERVAEGAYPVGAKIGILHTGGLQGRRALI